MCVVKESLEKMQSRMKSRVVDDHRQRCAVQTAMRRIYNFYATVPGWHTRHHMDVSNLRQFFLDAGIDNFENKSECAYFAFTHSCSCLDELLLHFSETITFPEAEQVTFDRLVLAFGSAGIVSLDDIEPMPEALIVTTSESIDEDLIQAANSVDRLRDEYCTRIAQRCSDQDAQHIVKTCLKAVFDYTDHGLDFLQFWRLFNTVARVKYATSNIMRDSCDNLEQATSVQVSEISLVSKSKGANPEQENTAQNATNKQGCTSAVETAHTLLQDKKASLTAAIRASDEKRDPVRIAELKREVERARLNLNAVVEYAPTATSAKLASARLRRQLALRAFEDGPRQGAQRDQLNAELQVAIAHEAEMAIRDHLEQLAPRAVYEDGADAVGDGGTVSGSGAGSGSGKKGWSVFKPSAGGYSVDNLIAMDAMGRSSEASSHPVVLLFTKHVMKNLDVGRADQAGMSEPQQLQRYVACMSTFLWAKDLQQAGITDIENVDQALQDLEVMRDDFEEREIRKRVAMQRAGKPSTATTDGRRATVVAGDASSTEIIADIRMVLDNLDAENENGVTLDDESLTVNWCFPGNLMQLFTIFLDMFSFLTVPFHEGIWWDVDQEKATDSIQVFTLTFSESDIYWYTFIGCSVVSYLYPPMARYGIKLLTVRSETFPNGRLGRDEFGNEAPVLSGMGIFLLALGTVSSALFFSIIKNLLKITICTYPEGVSAYHVNMVDVQCWSGIHLVYVGIAGVALLIYFPPASFLYPHLQFGDPGLDIKYKPVYLVMLNVCKLGMVGCSLFLDNDPIEMLFCALPFVILAWVLEYSLQPCLLKWVNHWRRYGYQFCIMAVVCAILVEITFDDINTSRLVWGTVLAVSLVANVTILVYRVFTVSEYQCGFLSEEYKLRREKRNVAKFATSNHDKITGMQLTDETQSQSSGAHDTIA